MSVDREARVDLKNRVIYLFGSVDNDMSFKAIAALHDMERSSKDDITVFLNTEGGSESDGWVLYDTFRRSPCDIKVVGIGEVQSMGMILLQMGDKRLLAPHVRCLIHLGWGPSMDDAPPALVLRALGKEQEVCDEMYVHCLAERSGQSYGDVLEWCIHETYMSSTEAIARGFADGLY